MKWKLELIKFWGFSKNKGSFLGCDCKKDYSIWVPFFWETTIVSFELRQMLVNDDSDMQENIALSIK